MNARILAGLVALCWMHAANARCEGDYLLRELPVESVMVTNLDALQLVFVLSTMGYETVRINSPAASPTSSQAVPGSFPTTMLPGTTMPQYPTGLPQTPTYPQAAPTYSVPQAPAQEAKLPESKRYSCDQLPVVVMPPDVDDSRLRFSAGDFLGLASSGGGGVSTLGIPSASGAQGRAGGIGDFSPALHTIERPHSGEVDQLLVFYHEDQLAEMRELVNLIRHQLDVPAKQIYIEGLVLEVSEEGLKELGIQYDRVDLSDERRISLGRIGASPVSAGGGGVVSIVRDTLLDGSGVADRTLLQLQALVSEGSAEVLSRPSVLTLSNRQATIQIIDVVQFPIQEATITSSGDIVQSAFKFEAVRPGITLNLRPRVSADLQHVSMEIDVTVEALVSANNGEVRGSDGQIIATKPGSSARRVQTFARIPDRTPIIIGGLISSDKESVRNRIPVLGRLPVVGKLFGATNDTIGKREVIIVLTPYVVSEETRANVSVPKDTSLFDTSAATLFQDSYRIRAEDVYDLQFLTGNPEYLRYRSQAERVRSMAPERASTTPFSHFLDGNVPGGDKFLNRMMFDLVRRRGFGADIDFDRLIVLGRSQDANTQAVLVRDLAARLAASPGHALFIVFDENEEGGPDQTARIDIKPIEGGRTWEEVLWNESYGADRSAIVVRNERDLSALVDSLLSAAIIERNGGHEKFTVGAFQAGKLITVPSFDLDRFYVVDEKVAKVYADVQHYYRAISRELERSYREMDVLRESSASNDNHD